MSVLIPPRDVPEGGHSRGSAGTFARGVPGHSRRERRGCRAGGVVSGAEALLKLHELLATNDTQEQGGRDIRRRAVRAIVEDALISPRALRR